MFQQEQSMNQYYNLGYRVYRINRPFSHKLEKLAKTRNLEILKKGNLLLIKDSKEGNFQILR